MTTPSSGSSAPALSSGKSTIDNPLNSNFFHHSTGPRTILVSQLLTRDNYASWSQALTIALLVKNKLGFIDESIPKPFGIDLKLLKLLDS